MLHLEKLHMHLVDISENPTKSPRFSNDNSGCSKVDSPISFDIDSLGLKSKENSFQNLEGFFDHAKKTLTEHEIESFTSCDNLNKISKLENKNEGNDIKESFSIDNGSCSKVNSPVSFDLEDLGLISEENSSQNLEEFFDQTKKIMTEDKTEHFSNCSNARNNNQIEHKKRESERNFEKIEKESYGILDTSSRQIELVFTKNIEKVKSILPPDANVNHDTNINILKINLIVDTCNIDMLDAMYSPFIDKRTINGKFKSFLLIIMLSIYGNNKLIQYCF